MQKLVAKCTIREEDIVCNSIPDGEPVQVNIERIDELTIIYYPKQYNSFDLEFETPIQQRIVCNGEYFNEFVWGTSRVMRWKTKNPVERVTCLIGKFKLEDYNNFIVVRNLKTSNKRNYIKYLQRILELCKNILGNTYKKYIVLDIDAEYKLNNKIFPPLTLPNTNTFIRDIIRSYFTVNNILVDKKNLNNIIDLLSDYLNYTLIKIDHANVLKTGIKYCISSKIDYSNKSIYIINNCREKIALLIFIDNSYTGLLILRENAQIKIKYSKHFEKIDLIPIPISKQG